MLRVLPRLVRVIVVACLRNLDVAPAGMLQKKLESIGVPELRDPMEIGDQPFGIVLFRAREEKRPFVPLVVPGAPLGSSDTTEFNANTQPFEVGDLLICYTDGLIEAQNTAGEAFGDKRVRQTVQRCHARNVEEICELLLGEVSRFVGNSKLDDDQTLVVARNLPLSAQGR